MSSAVVMGSFDDLKSRHVRFLEEASKLGDVQVLLWSDEAVRSLEGKSPEFPIEERLYVLQAIRYVSAVSVVDGPIERDAIPPTDGDYLIPPTDGDYLIPPTDGDYLIPPTDGDYLIPPTDGDYLIPPTDGDYLIPPTDGDYPIPQFDGLWNNPRLLTGQPNIWVTDEASDTPQKRAYCEARGLTYRVVKDQKLKGFPLTNIVGDMESPVHKKVVVTGCYDWFHSGHVRFFEEVSRLGDLYVVAGSDANLRLLKGEGHPLFPEDERRYMVQSVRYVKQALVSTGQGWMDAEPEIDLIKPDIYAVNEDGDKPEKREFCQARGIQYVVLKRTPKEGLPRRQSTDLRGF